MELASPSSHQNTSKMLGKSQIVPGAKNIVPTVPSSDIRDAAPSQGGGGFWGAMCSLFFQPNPPIAVGCGGQQGQESPGVAAAQGEHGVE